MSRNTQKFAKCKIFSADPRYLQRILDSIANAFGISVIVSSIKPSVEGDYHAYITWTKPTNSDTA